MAVARGYLNRRHLKDSRCRERLPLSSPQVPEDTSSRRTSGSSVPSPGAPPTRRMDSCHRRGTEKWVPHPEDCHSPVCPSEDPAIPPNLFTPPEMPAPLPSCTRMACELSDPTALWGIYLMSWDAPVHIIVKLNKCVCLSAVNLPVVSVFYRTGFQT